MDFGDFVKFEILNPSENQNLRSLTLDHKIWILDNKNFIFWWILNKFDEKFDENCKFEILNPKIQNLTKSQNLKSLTLKSKILKLNFEKIWLKNRGGEFDVSSKFIKISWLAKMRLIQIGFGREILTHGRTRGQEVAPPRQKPRTHKICDIKNFDFGRPKFVQIWRFWCFWKAEIEIYPNLAKKFEIGQRSKIWISARVKDFKFSIFVKIQNFRFHQNLTKNQNSATVVYHNLAMFTKIRWSKFWKICPNMGAQRDKTKFYKINSSPPLGLDQQNILAVFRTFRRNSERGFFHRYYGYY